MAFTGPGKADNYRLSEELQRAAGGWQLAGRKGDQALLDGSAVPDWLSLPLGAKDRAPSSAKSEPPINHGDSLAHQVAGIRRASGCVEWTGTEAGQACISRAADIKIWNRMNFPGYARSKEWARGHDETLRP